MSGAVDQLDPVVVHHLVNTLGWQELRPLQEAAVAPLLAGDDALLIAPTAAGKTEAAIFPLLSRMASERWSGVSVLYLCPLKALLNNVQPRLDRYAGWLGARAEVWHGDTPTAVRRRIQRDPPQALLTTPESLEAMLVSVNVDHRTFFSGLRAVVVDELHAFAGDDRGWHLLAVLERLTHLVGRPIQRVGLSATVGNPDELLEWLQGSNRRVGLGRVIAEPRRVSGNVPAGDVELDYVGTLANAATVIASLHAGEKRLVFCEARRTVEELGQLLRAAGVRTFLSHASLSVEERRRAEEAFAEATDCVIVSTSTLELGIDVGDLDRVIQVGAPSTVAAFLQRMGRTGRRADAVRNALVLAVDTGSLVRAAGLLVCWARGWVEPVTPPPEPRHIVAQQLLALCLQEKQVGSRTWREWWNGVEPFGIDAGEIGAYLVAHGFVDSDADMWAIGPSAELRFGRRHFMDMTAVFTAPPEFTMLLGRSELGRVDPSLLVGDVQGDRKLLLGGRSWKVTHIDWQRRRCFVEPAAGGGRARWSGWGSAGLGHKIARASREVLLGDDPPVRLTKRARTHLAEQRERFLSTVHPGGTVVTREADNGDVRWWTWAGLRANATLIATLPDVVDPAQRFDDYYVRLRADVAREELQASIAVGSKQLRSPIVSERAMVGLKFSDALPKSIALATLSRRFADFDGASVALGEAVRFVTL